MAQNQPHRMSQLGKDTAEGEGEVEEAIKDKT